MVTFKNIVKLFEELKKTNSVEDIMMMEVGIDKDGVYAKGREMTYEK